MFQKRFSFDELLEKLRGMEILASPKDSVPHLNWEETFEYLERRYELPLDDPLKRRILSHIIECQRCHALFTYAHDLVGAIETDSIPESSQESKEKAYAILGLTPPKES